jgi:hypothetical protein
MNEKALKELNARWAQMEERVKNLRGGMEEKEKHIRGFNS